MKKYKIEFLTNENVGRALEIIINYYSALGFEEDEILLYLFSRGVSDVLKHFDSVNDKAFLRGYIDIDQYLDIKNLFKSIMNELGASLQLKFVKSELEINPPLDDGMS